MTLTRSRKNRAFTVLVTGTGGGGHGEQIIKALRLGEFKYKIIGTDIDRYSTGRSTVDIFELVPPAADPVYIDHVLSLTEKYGIGVIFHGSEPEMKILSKNRSVFEERGIYIPINRHELIEICSDKVETFKYLAQHGIQTMNFREVKNLSDLDGYDTYPSIIKPAVGGGGSNNVFIIQSRKELDSISIYLLNFYEKLIIQEYIGNPDEEYTVGVLYGKDGKFINSIALKRIINNSLTTRTKVRNITHRKDLGEFLVISSGVSQGIIESWPEIRGKCEKIAEILNPTAPINIQCRYINNEVIPFEINPRFSGTTSLRAMAGYNEPDVLIRRDVFGEKISIHFKYSNKILLRKLQEEQITLSGSG